MKPRVSVVLSVFNGENYICESVESVLCQSMPDFEFIIINDGSTDGTGKQLSEYKDKRIKVITTVNKGLAAALNHGVELAQSNYIARIDADDVCCEKRFELQLLELQSNPEISVLGSYARLIDKDGESMGRIIKPPLHHNRILDNLFKIKGKNLIHPTIIFKKNIFQKVGGYDERLPASQDLDLWFKMSVSGVLAVIPEILINYRVHDKAISTSSREKQLLCGMIARLGYLQRNKVRGNKNDPIDWPVVQQQVVEIVNKYKLQKLDADLQRYRAKLTSSNTAMDKLMTLMQLMITTKGSLFFLSTIFRRKYFGAMNELFAINN